MKNFNLYITRRRKTVLRGQTQRYNERFPAKSARLKLRYRRRLRQNHQWLSPVRLHLRATTMRSTTHLTRRYIQMILAQNRIPKIAHEVK